jgi:uncharacterized protein YuzE
MKTSYDLEADAFYVRFAPEAVGVESTDEVAPGVMIDYDSLGRVVGIEVLSVSRLGASKAETANPAAAE